MTIRTRIAPSPTGFPHVGTIFQGLLDYVYAHQQGGQFIIRIEDTDQGRYVEGAENDIYESLEWAGITPDEGPKYGGPVGPYRQSERLDIYQKYAHQLVDQGHAYYCFCSPKRLEQVRNDRQKQGLPPMYDRHCRDLDPAEAKKRIESEKYVIRMKIPDNETIITHDFIRGDISFDSNVVDDQVILKSDGFPTYHLAVVVDDHLMNISFMVRGEEWLSSSPKHILLYRYFGWQPPVMLHTPLLRNPDKSKLSKRHGHASVKWYREQGYLPEALVNFLATRIWNHPDGQEIFTMDELLTKFKIEDIHIMSPIADLKKLDWINGLWIRSLSDTELIKRLEPYRPQDLPPELLARILPLYKQRLIKLSELESLTCYFYREPVVTKTFEPEVVGFFSQVIDSLPSISAWQAASIETTLRELQVASGLKPKTAFMALRDALTGQDATPPLFDIMEILGQDTVLRRLKPYC